MAIPLDALKSVALEEPATVRQRVATLLGRMSQISDQAHGCLAECLWLLTKKTPSAVDEQTVNLGVRFWNDLHAASRLTRSGIYLQATMMHRDALETMATIEYLHSVPEDAEAWWKAKTKKDRLRFSLNSIKGKIKDGDRVKDAWDSLSSLIYPNAKSTPAYAADKPYFGHNLFLGGFYYPRSASTDFCIQVGLCIDLLEKLRDWYPHETLPPSILKRMGSLRNEYDTEAALLDERTKSEVVEVVDKVVATRLSGDKALAWLRSRYGQP